MNEPTDAPVAVHEVPTLPDPGGAIAGSLFFVGNATVVLRLAGLTILTDPNFVPRGTAVPIGYGLTTTRLTDPAITMDELPPIDAVLLSHLHGDHFDQLVEMRLDRAIPIVTNPQAADALRDMGFRDTRPLETWESLDLSSPEGTVRITSMPGRHAPGPLEVVLPDVMGSLIEVRRGPAAPAVHEVPQDAQAALVTPDRPDLRLYISGDTLVFDELREIPARAGAIDRALLHLGGTRVMGVTVTMDAEGGLELIRILEPKRADAIHYDDYEAFKSPIEDFVEAVAAANLTESVGVLKRGDTIELFAPAAR